MDRNALLASTRAEFLQACLQAVSRALPRAAATLFRTAEATFSAPDQRRLLGAYGLFREREADLLLQLQRSMDQLLHRSFQTTYSTFRPSFSASYGDAELTLLDTGEHDDQLRIGDATGRFRHAADNQLRDLNIRVAILFEQDHISERENPFRPFLLARAMATAIDNLGQLVEFNTTLFDQLALDMAGEVATVYDTVNAHLAQHGIAAQLQLKIVKSVDTAATVTTAAPLDPTRVDNGERALSHGAPRGRVEQLVDLVRHIARPLATAGPAGTSWIGPHGLVGTLQQLFSPARQPGPGLRPLSVKLGEALGALMDHAIPAGAEMTGSDGELRNLLFEHRDRLGDSSADSNEQMTIDVVAMLFEFILRDPHIPAEVRAQLGRLQFLVLKVALRESALLTSSRHPARLLVNRIGTISAGLKQIDPDGLRVSAEICRIVDILLADRSDDSRLFATMLDEFDAFIARQLRVSDEGIEAAVQALEHARSRTLRFTHLGAQLAQVLAGLSIDPFLQEFLGTTWIRVIERAERDSVASARRFRQLVPDLLWSILPKYTAAERSELVGLLPTLVALLREGMLQENLSGARRQEVLNWLVDVHSRALRGGEPGTTGPARATIHLHLEPFTLATADGGSTVAAPASVLHHGAFLAEALQESDATLELLDPLIENASALSPAPADSASTDDVLARLRSGVAIDITLGTIPGTGRLHWVDQDSTTLLLQMDDHPTPSMMSVRMFLRLMGLGRVRFNEPAPLFERAVQALMISAQEMEKVAG